MFFSCDSTSNSKVEKASEETDVVEGTDISSLIDIDADTVEDNLTKEIPDDMGIGQGTSVTPLYQYLFRDYDNDGYGNINDSIQLEITGKETEYEGYVTDNTDCEDFDQLINPGQTEICDNVDNNCNGEIDDGSEKKEYYKDADNDGFGDPNTSILSCNSVQNYVLDNGDQFPNNKWKVNGIDQDNDNIDNLFDNCPNLYNEDQFNYCSKFVNSVIVDNVADLQNEMAKFTPNISKKIIIKDGIYSLSSKININFGNIELVAENSGSVTFKNDGSITDEVINISLSSSGSTEPRFIIIKGIIIDCNNASRGLFTYQIGTNTRTIVDSVEIVNGNAGVIGGGIYGVFYNGSTLTIANSFLHSNEVGMYGGGIGVNAYDETKIIIANSIVSHNEIIEGAGDGGGGGIFVQMNGSSSVIVLDSEISFNKVVRGGGGIGAYLKDETKLNIINSIINDNISTQGNGGGISLFSNQQSEPTILNSLFIENSDLNEENDIIFDTDTTSNSKVRIYSNIFYNSSIEYAAVLLSQAQDAKGNYLGSAEIKYNSFYNPNTVGCLTKRAFTCLDSDDTWITNVKCNPSFSPDYHLASDSSCVNKGPKSIDDFKSLIENNLIFDLLAKYLTFDKDGNQRYLGDASDSGAYEIK